MAEHSENSFSLFELNEHLKRVVAFNMREPVWISCEIADVNSNKGNVYLSLVERDDVKISAKADGVIWHKTIDNISKKIGDSLWSILQVGRQVLLKVQVEFHEFYGMKLSIKDIDPSVTIGQLELKRMQILKQLQSEQFDELNGQVSSALVWQRIAVISSRSAAGLQDFMQQLEENPHGYHFKMELFEAAVQGINVSADVIKQIEIIEKRKEDFDCIAIVRGGGARLDLMGFDDYDLCVAIATCELPVLTGIGHDIDETLADIVAFHPLKTPTAVADFLLHKMLVFESTLLQYAQEIKQVALQKIKNQEALLDVLEEQMRTAVNLQFKLANQELEGIEEKLRLLDPKTILSRGFVALTDEHGKMLSSIEDLEEGLTYALHLIDGKVSVNIIKSDK